MKKSEEEINTFILSTEKTHLQDKIWKLQRLKQKDIPRIHANSPNLFPPIALSHSFSTAMGINHECHSDNSLLLSPGFPVQRRAQFRYNAAALLFLFPFSPHLCRHPLFHSRHRTDKRLYTSLT